MPRPTGSNFCAAEPYAHGRERIIFAPALNESAAARPWAPRFFCRYRHSITPLFAFAATLKKFLPSDRASFSDSGLCTGLSVRDRERRHVNALGNVSARQQGVGSRAGTVRLPVLDPRSEPNFGAVCLIRHGEGEPINVVAIDDMALTPLQPDQGRRGRDRSRTRRTSLHVFSPRQIWSEFTATARSPSQA